MKTIKEKINPIGPNSKQINYAYPTSEHAREFGLNDVGCFVVELKYTNHKEFIGPFGSARQAEGFAEQFNLDWDKYYKRFPLPGSKFKKVEANR